MSVYSLMGFGDFEWDDAANVENDILNNKKFLKALKRKLETV